MIQSAKGTYDILPNDSYKWHYLEKIIREVCDKYNYKEIRTPIFESTDLFVRGVGESTDIVTKEMYTFKDKGDRSITLRPEGTAGVVRAYVEHKLFSVEKELTKLYYMGPMFRYERMQKGRYRQLHQFGVEAIGSFDSSLDAEVIALSVNIFRTLGLKEVKVIINTLGDMESRHSYKDALINHFRPHIDSLCDDCKKRLTENPLRVLDCKVDREHIAMKTAPKMIDYLTSSASAYFNQVLKYLDDLDIKYELDSNLVRGLDYYNHTVFEIVSNVEGFGAQTALGGGGRYNGLVQEIGGPDVPGVGMAFGMDRLILALEAEKVEIPDNFDLDVYVVSMTEKTNSVAFKLQEVLRRSNIKADKDYFDRKLKVQFKQADKYNAKYVILVGEEEYTNGKVIIKDLKSETQELISIDKVVNELKQRLEEEYGK